MLLSSISNSIYKCLPKTFNFAVTEKPCRKKAKACEKTFTSSKKFVEYETTNECQLCRFS